MVSVSRSNKLMRPAGSRAENSEDLLRDEMLRPDASVAAAKELITKDGVNFIIGPATSATSLAVSELAKTEHIVNISPSAKTEAYHRAPNFMSTFSGSRRQPMSTEFAVSAS